MVKLSQVEYKVGRKTLLHRIDLAIGEGECLAVTGANGSGKTLLGKILAGQLEPTSGSIDCNRNPSYVSFERQEAVLEEERRRDDSRFFDGDGSENSGRSLEEWIREGKADNASGNLEEILENLGLFKIKDRGLRYLSTGEFRKTMVARALWEQSDFIILDDPYDGLDRDAAAYLREMIDGLIEAGITLVIISGRRDDLPEQADKQLILEEGQILRYGKSIFGKVDLSGRKTAGSIDSPYQSDWKLSSIEGEASLLRFRNVNVAYGEKKILTRLDWSVKRGDKWLISGPNGAGKSTLLSLINGDNPKAYGKDISLFGKKKGTGESVWEIKEKIGFVSGGFQMNYRVRSPLAGVVLSGFFDSIGLYDKPTEKQREIAEQWIEFCGLAPLAKAPYEELSFGEKRMALIARSLVKSPPLLILDEPCQGLDDRHRDDIVSLCETLGEIPDLTMLYVTHSDANTPGTLDRHLRLVPHEKGGYTAGSLHQGYSDS